MPDSPQRSFDPIWAKIDSDTLKRIAKTFGGKTSWRRDECVAFLQAAIKDEERVKGAVQMQPPHNVALLSLLKFLGGEADREQLKLAVYASGVRLPGARFGYLDPFEDALQKFLRSGLIFNRRDYGSPTDLRSYSGVPDIIFSDDRVLKHVGSPTFQPIETQPVSPSQNASARSPRLISMQMIGILHAIESLHGLKVTKNSELRVTEARKLAKMLDWKDDSLVEGDFVLPRATQFSIGVLRSAGILQVRDELLLPTPKAREFAEWPVEEQVRMLLQGIIHTENWHETDRFYVGFLSRNFPIGRFALYAFLLCLPAAQPVYYSMDDFDLTFFQRIGEHFKLLSYMPRFQSFDRDPKAVELKYVRWLAEQRESWLKTERVWLEEALKTWLYFLGIVSLELQNGRPAAVALSDLGRAVLHPGQLTSKPASQPVDNPNQAGWVVQPNFDVIAYLDHLSNAQLAFLERNAERLRTGDHVAEYRITRDSVYRGLESGMNADEILAAWQTGSGKDLPQNVSVEVREWAAIRERMTLYRRANLAEYPDPAARQAAIDRGIKGTPVGERFLLITQALSKAEVKSFYASIDYAHAPLRCLMIEEDGAVTVSEHPDLVLANQLAEWTEADPSGSLRLTRASIQRAIQKGRTIAALFKLLEERIVRIMPPIMQISLRAWSGQSYQIGMGSVLVLFSPSPDISYAIQTSTTLRPYLRGILAPGYFMVKAELADQLKARLQDFGLEVQLIEVAQRD
jgi:hypothetical protein